MAVNYRDDFYEAVNGEWIDQAVIPSDKPGTGGFYDLADDVENLERDVVAELESDSQKEIPELREFIAFHQLTKDWDERGKDEKGQVEKFLKPLLSINSFKDLLANEGQLILDAYTTPLAMQISPDSKDTSKNELWFGDPSLILPDVTSYQDAEQKEKLLTVWTKMTKTLLVKLGFEEEGADKLIKDTLDFDQLLADRESSREDLSDSWKNYHPMSLAELQKKFGDDYQLAPILEKVLGQVPDKVIVYDGPFFDKASEVYNHKNFSLLYAWTIVQNVLDIAPFLGNETRIEAGTYGRALSGAKEAADKSKAAFRQARAFFSQAVGRWYGQTYFGEEAKKDVEDMVKEMIKVYESRFDSQKWLSEDTRKKAKVKLAALDYKIGYPSKLPRYLAKRTVDTTKSLIENIQEFSKEAVKDHYSKWGKEPDKSRWEMPGDLVNAYYSPDFNHIVFPAAILQAPFYDFNQTKSQNYGGIGTVMAHEITHAFDTNGARYDEYGNLNEWWTKQDFANFEERTDAVVAAFDGQDSAGAKINGHLTVSENVADLGGVSAALAAAKKLPDFSAEEFFINFATLWRQKVEPEYLQMLAKIDVHAPGRLRTNVILPNFDDFHETFDINEGDGMWLDPEDRIQIW